MMKSRRVYFSEAAQRDLFELEDWLLSVASKRTARDYIDRLVDYCLSLDLAAERGSRRDDVRPGLRVIGFEGRITIALTVDGHEVLILRLFAGGRDWETDLSEN